MNKQKDGLFRWELRVKALAWHARGRRFDPDTLHNKKRLASHLQVFFVS